MKWALLVALALAILAAWFVARRRRAAARGALLLRLDKVVRLLASQLGPDSELLDVTGGALVVRVGAKTVRIDVLLAMDRLEGCPPGELGDRVRWLVNHAELRAGQND